jgi:hypothetical protein
MDPAEYHRDDRFFSWIGDRLASIQLIIGAAVRHKNFRLIIVVVLLLLGAFPSPGTATGGLPDSATFGYGARINIWGEDVYAALELASSMGLDWLAIDVDWTRHWPTLDQPADFSRLDYVLQVARQKQISILISLTHAPTWALTATGPEPNFTNALLQSILDVYSDVIKAVELFPGVNTSSRWGTAPDPLAYLTMLQTVRQGCDASGRAVYLVTTVEPTLPGDVDESLEDRIFLESLYNLGGTPYLPIIGIRFPELKGAPMSDQGELYPITLRHYELVRNLMLQHQHAHGMLWITGFSWPTSGTVDPADPLTLPVTPTQQAQWVNQAFQLLRAQLFIGTAFFSSLNADDTTQAMQILYRPGGSLHPASVAISQFASGSVTTTSWIAPHSQADTTQASVIGSAPFAQIKFLRFEGKAQK